MCGHVRALRQVRGRKRQREDRHLAPQGVQWSGMTLGSASPWCAMACVMQGDQGDGVNQSPLILLDAPLIPLCIKTEARKTCSNPVGMCTCFNGTELNEATLDFTFVVGPAKGQGPESTVAQSVSPQLYHGLCRFPN